MHILKADEMRELDRITIQEIGVDAAILMENAGRSVYSVIRELVGDVGGLKAVVVAGKGNNGGDGFVVARYLYNDDADVIVYLLGQEGEVKGSAKKNLEILKNLGVEIVELQSEDEFTLFQFDVETADVVIDAIFGTGFKGDVEGIYADVIDAINDSEGIVVSVDIPSGVNSDTGEVGTTAVTADFTVTMAFPKLGHFLYPGKLYTGELVVANIGIPEDLAYEKVRRLLIDGELVSDLVPLRAGNEHKGELGRVLVVAGSRGYTGAAALASAAAMRAGAGLTYLAIPQSLNDILEVKLTEVITIPVDEDNGTITERAVDELLAGNKRFDVAAIGPGLTRKDNVKKAILKFVREFDGPMVIDADAVVALAGNLDVLKDREIPPILTPHPGEMSHLIDMSPEEIDRDRVDVASKFATEHGVILVLKGAPTIVAMPGGMVYVNTSGNAGLASGGTGDVLTGIITGLLGQGLLPQDAALLGVFLHGLAADIAVEELSEQSLMATDLLDYIPEAYNYLTNYTEIEELYEE